MPSIIQAGNAASTGLVTTGATDGILELRSGTASGGTVAMTINVAGAVSAANGLAVTGASSATTNFTLITDGFASKTISGVGNDITINSPSDVGTVSLRAAGDNRGVFSSTGLAVTGALSCTGALSKGSGSFRVDHPLPELTATRQLVHSFIEGPKADLIYRGKVALVDGQATVNIDTAATMTEGTFEVLCRDVQCFTTNESDWICVRGKVTGNILTIEAEDITATSVVSWMVIGERQDPHMMETEWTDENGRVIVEPLKPISLIGI